MFSAHMCTKCRIILYLHVHLLTKGIIWHLKSLKAGLNVRKYILATSREYAMDTKGSLRVEMVQSDSGPWIKDQVTVSAYISEGGCHPRFHINRTPLVKGLSNLLQKGVGQTLHELIMSQLTEVNTFSLGTFWWLAQCINRF